MTGICRMLSPYVGRGCGLGRKVPEVKCHFDLILSKVRDQHDLGQLVLTLSPGLKFELVRFFDLLRRTFGPPCVLWVLYFFGLFLNQFEQKPLSQRCWPGIVCKHGFACDLGGRPHGWTS